MCYLSQQPNSTNGKNKEKKSNSNIQELPCLSFAYAQETGRSGFPGFRFRSIVLGANKLSPAVDGFAAPTIPKPKANTQKIVFLFGTTVLNYKGMGNLSRVLERKQNGKSIVKRVGLSQFEKTVFAKKSQAKKVFQKK